MIPECQLEFLRTAFRMLLVTSDEFEEAASGRYDTEGFMREIHRRQRQGWTTPHQRPIGGGFDRSAPKDYTGTPVRTLFLKIV